MGSPHVFYPRTCEVAIRRRCQHAPPIVQCSSKKRGKNPRVADSRAFYLGRSVILWYINALALIDSAVKE